MTAIPVFFVNAAAAASNASVSEAAANTVILPGLGGAAVDVELAKSIEATAKQKEPFGARTDSLSAKFTP